MIKLSSFLDSQKQCFIVLQLYCFSFITFIPGKQTACLLLSVLYDLQFPSSRAILLDASLPLNDPSFRVRHTKLFLLYSLLVYHRDGIPTSGYAEATRDRGKKLTIIVVLLLGLKKKSINKIYNHVSKQAGIYVLPLCIYFYFQILEFVASKFCVIYIFHCPHFFWKHGYQIGYQTFFSMPTLTKVQSLSNLFYIWQMFFFFESNGVRA